jgi:uridine kinase
MKQPFLIGITGGSCSGKTAIARELSRRLEGNAAAVIPMDSYYLDLSHMREAERALQNFDHPDAIDFGFLMDDLKRLLAGDEIIVPAYDFASHTRKPRGEGHAYLVPTSSKKRPVVILEGLHALHREEIRELEDLRVFIDCAPETCLSRRIERDARERGRDPDSVRRQWKATVTPMYRMFVEPRMAFAHIIINGGRPVDESVRRILAHDRMRTLLRDD